MVTETATGGTRWLCWASRRAHGVASGERSNKETRLVVELLEFAGDARLRVQVEDDEEEAWEEGAKDHGCRRR